MTITEIMNLERVLLEIQARHMFDLEMSELLELFGYLKRIGDMTNLFFYAQEMFTEKNQSESDLEEYRNRLLSDGNIAVGGVDGMASFVSSVCGRLGDAELEELARRMRVLPENA